MYSSTAILSSMLSIRSHVHLKMNQTMPGIHALKVKLSQQTVPKSYSKKAYTTNWSHDSLVFLQITNQLRDITQNGFLLCSSSWVFNLSKDCSQQNTFTFGGAPAFQINKYGWKKWNPSTLIRNSNKFTWKDFGLVQHPNFPIVHAITYPHWFQQSQKLCCLHASISFRFLNK